MVRALSFAVLFACISLGCGERMGRIHMQQAEQRPDSANYVKQNLQPFQNCSRLRPNRSAAASNELRGLVSLLMGFNIPVAGQQAIRRIPNLGMSYFQGKLTRLCARRRRSLGLCMVSATAEETCVEAAFAEAVRLCELKRESAEVLSPEVPRLLRQVFDADSDHILTKSDKTVWNVTCMQPAEENRGYGLYNEKLLDLPLQHGRVCKYGNCCSKCSRVYIRLASDDECNQFVREISQTLDSTNLIYNFNLPTCAATNSIRTTLMFLRLVERVRRAVAFEYGHDLSCVLPYSCHVFARRPGATDLGVHADESSYPNVHYSSILYLGTENEDFEGGELQFVGKDREADEYRFTGVSPERGMNIMFSSGWENMHQVKPVKSGCRFSILTFFSTEPRPRPSRESLPDDSEMADMLWRKILDPTAEQRFSEFLSQWHYWLVGAELNV